MGRVLARRKGREMGHDMRVVFEWTSGEEKTTIHLAQVPRLKDLVKIDDRAGMVAYVTWKLSTGHDSLHEVAIGLAPITGWDGLGGSDG